MSGTYFLILILLLHIIFFKKIIFNWNILGVFFIASIIFSGIGILSFPFIKSYVIEAFSTFKLEYITSEIIIKTQMIFVFGLLIILYSYSFGIMVIQKKLIRINHFTFKGKIKENLSKTNFYFIIFLIGIFLFVYLVIKRETLMMGIFDGLLGRKPIALILSRRAITSNYLYVVITYNLLPFLTTVALYLLYKKKTLTSKLLFYSILSISLTLVLLLFQKRPLIVFLLTLGLANYVFSKKMKDKKVRNPKKKLTKKQQRKKYIIYGVLLFSLLLLLYYSSTTYQFDSVFQAVVKLSEVSLLRVFGRLAIPSFFYVHHFPEIRFHYGVTNIGMLSKVLHFEFFPDTAILYDYYSIRKKGGSLAINTIFDFYGAFGYVGVVVGTIILGLLLSVLDSFLHLLEKNGVNLIFTIFCFVFAYYLSQANFARSLMGYGFFFFVMIWMFLQKGFKIKLR